MQVWPGRRYPLGATYDGMGTTVAIFSEVADAIELCLFDEWGIGFRFDLAATLNRGTSGRAATRWATSRPCGPSGTASTATRCATSGGASRPPSRSSPPGSPDRPTSTRATGASRFTASTSSPVTTLADLVSYDDKHNGANGEDNRDGESHNQSWNCGVEGPTNDHTVLALRARQRRNFVAMLLLSQACR